MKGENIYTLGCATFGEISSVVPFSALFRNSRLILLHQTTAVHRSFLSLNISIESQEKTSSYILYKRSISQEAVGVQFAKINSQIQRYKFAFPED